MERVIIHTDGGSRGNPGPAAIGVVFEGKGNAVIKKYAETIGQATNNVAEYRAVIFALKKAKQLFGKNKVKQMEFQLNIDSELVVKQLNHQYKIKESDLQKLFIEIWNLVLDFGQVAFSHVSRERNRQADALVNQALDQDQSKLF